MNKILLSAIVASASVFASAGTIATFADPSNNQNNPLFVFNTSTNILTGSWTGTGLTVQTPGFNNPGSISNAKFVTSSISLTPVGGGLYNNGAGTITFYTSDVNNPFMVIGFSGATLFNPLGFGASEFSGSIVSIIGPDIPTNLSGEQFAFSFANPAQNGNNVTYTAAFTSSAVPEPATMTALGLGLAAIMRRRRNK